MQTNQTGGHVYSAYFPLRWSFICTNCHDCFLNSQYLMSIPDLSADSSLISIESANFFKTNANELTVDVFVRTTNPFAEDLEPGCVVMGPIP